MINHVTRQLFCLLANMWTWLGQKLDSDMPEEIFYAYD